jgi:mono/diheme cytochrome c family protein
MTRTLTTLALALALTLPLALATPVFAEGDEATEEAGDTGGATGIAAVWNKNCASCHGKDGKGQTKAGKTKKVQDLTDPAVRAKFDRDRMIKATKEGIKDDAGKDRMKAYAGKLSDADIAALTDYVINTLK